MKKSSGSRFRKHKLTAVGTRCVDHVTPLYPQKLALTSPTGGGHSVGIVRVRTKATEFGVSPVEIRTWALVCAVISSVSTANSREDTRDAMTLPWPHATSLTR